jgi:hypothetical protein
MELRVTIDTDGVAQVLFPINFELNQNFIDFNTVIRTAIGIQHTFRGADIALYDVDYLPDLIFGTAEPGSVIEWVGKKTKQAALLGGAFAVEQFTDGFLEATTGKTFRDWGEEAATKVYELPSYIGDGSEAWLNDLQMKMAEAEVCRKLLEVNEDQLESILAERPDAAASVKKGRRIFYEACRANEDLPSVRFGTSSLSPSIPRREFPMRTHRDTIDRIATPELISGDWKTAILSIEVTSPNWESLDQQRGWKGKLEGGKYIYFHISDSRFWKRVSDKTLAAEVPDTMVAQVVYQGVGGRYKNAEAIRILKFNNDKISEQVNIDLVRQKLDERRIAGQQFQHPLFNIDD